MTKEGAECGRDKDRKRCVGAMTTRRRSQRQAPALTSARDDEPLEPPTGATDLFRAEHSSVIGVVVSKGATAKLLVVGCGAIGGVVASHLLATGQDVSVLTTNRAIGEALVRDGFRVDSDVLSSAVPARAVLFDAAEVDRSFDSGLLAVQPAQVRAAGESVAGKLAEHARGVCFQNGLCEELVAEVIGAERVIGGVVDWGASMSG